MCEADLEQEKDAVDFITNCMFSLSFLESISDIIFSSNKNSLTVGQFYDNFLKKSGATKPKIPYNQGAVLGYLYCGILFAKEHWFDLLPDVDLANADPKWGLSGLACIAPKMIKPSLKDTVRRIRNALGHGNVDITVPKDIKDRTELMTRVTIHFHDENMKDSSDTFDIIPNLKQLYEFVKTFQSEIHQHVRSKK